MVLYSNWNLSGVGLYLDVVFGPAWVIYGKYIYNLIVRVNLLGAPSQAESAICKSIVPTVFTGNM